MALLQEISWGRISRWSEKQAGEQVGGGEGDPRDSGLGRRVWLGETRQRVGCGEGASVTQSSGAAGVTDPHETVQFVTLVQTDIPALQLLLS